MAHTFTEEELADTRPVQVVFCPCGKKVRQAGQPNDKPTLKEKRRMGEHVADGCKIDKLTIGEYRKNGYDMCFEQRPVAGCDEPMDDED